MWILIIPNENGVPELVERLDSRDECLEKANEVGYGPNDGYKYGFSDERSAWEAYDPTSGIWIGSIRAI